MTIFWLEMLKLAVQNGLTAAVLSVYKNSRIQIERKVYDNCTRIVPLYVSHH